MNASNTQNIFLDFYGFFVQLRSNSQLLLEKIRKDFSYFICSPKDKINVTISALMQNIPFEKIPPAVALKQNASALTYQTGKIRYNDYHGRLLSIYNYQNESGTLYSPDEELLHEITYLLILSRIGKMMDLKGLHKLHAFGVTINGIACLGMMPMKGGKSSLFLELIKDPQVEIISDDTPIIDRRGHILPFPQRIGLEHIPSDIEIQESGKNLYSLTRSQYGKKQLIAIDGLKNPINHKYQKIVLFNGKRSNLADCQLIPTCRLKLFFPMIKHCIIGFGLPMILEYYLETGPKDFLRKVFIIMSRSWATIAILLRAKCYTFILSNNKALNGKHLKQFLDAVSSKSHKA